MEPSGYLGVAVPCVPGVGGAVGRPRSSGGDHCGLVCWLTGVLCPAPGPHRTEGRKVTILLLGGDCMKYFVIKIFTANFLC